MLTAAIIAAALLGACAGSFLGVVVYRMPRGLSIVTPPSRCGACGTKLGTLENIPILGWLLLRGRCKHCGTAIPLSCPVMEVAVGAITALVTWAVLTKPYLWCLPLAAAGHPYLALACGLTVLLLLTWLLIASMLIDWDHLIIPDELTKGLQTVAIPLAVLTSTNMIWPWTPIVESVASLVANTVSGGDWQPTLDPQWWFRTWDAMEGWIGTPTTAAWRLGMVALVGLGLIALSLPLARRVYGNLKETWEERDHRAMAMGAWWFIGTTSVWTTIAIIAILAIGPGPLANDWHPGRILCLGLAQAILGALVGWWLPWTIGLVGTTFFKRNAMGFGDVKLFCALGAFLGPVGTVAAFMFATVVGALVGIPMRLLGGGREIPFGPYLAAGAALAIALGPWLAPWMLGSLIGR